MKKKKLHITEQRMLQLIGLSIERGWAKHETDYLAQISFPRQNISNIRNGTQRFTRDHIDNACKLTGASADWIYGYTNTIMRKEEKITPLERLKMTVLELETCILPVNRGSNKKEASDRKQFY